jgi:hypothetical protein
MKSMFFQPGLEAGELSPAKKAKKDRSHHDAKPSSSHQQRHHKDKKTIVTPMGGKLLRKGQNSGKAETGEGEGSKEDVEQEKRGVASLVVKYLTPHYKAGRFANKVRGVLGADHLLVVFLWALRFPPPSKCDKS